MSHMTNQIAEQTNRHIISFANDVAIALEVDKTELTECFELTKSEHWDSLGLVSVMNLIDRHFQVYLDFYDVHNCKTFGDLLMLAENKKTLMQEKKL